MSGNRSGKRKEEKKGGGGGGGGERRVKRCVREGGMARREI